MTAMINLAVSNFVFNKIVSFALSDQDDVQEIFISDDLQEIEKIVVKSRLGKTVSNPRFSPTCKSDDTEDIETDSDQDMVIMIDDISDENLDDDESPCYQRNDGENVSRRLDLAESANRSQVKTYSDDDQDVIEEDLDDDENQDEYTASEKSVSRRLVIEDRSSSTHIRTVTNNESDDDQDVIEEDLDDDNSSLAVNNHFRQTYQPVSSSLMASVSGESKVQSVSTDQNISDNDVLIPEEIQKWVDDAPSRLRNEYQRASHQISRQLDQAALHEGRLEVVGRLNLHEYVLLTLPPVNFYRGDLNLYDMKIESLDKNLFVKGNLVITKSSISHISPNTGIEGDFVAVESNLLALPNDLVVLGNVNLRGSINLNQLGMNAPCFGKPIGYKPSILDISLTGVGDAVRDFCVGVGRPFNVEVLFNDRPERRDGGVDPLRHRSMGVLERLQNQHLKTVHPDCFQ